MHHQTISITGTTCQACKKLIEKRILTIPGVTEVDVNFQTGITVIITNRLIGRPEITKVLEGLPYEQKS